MQIYCFGLMPFTSTRTNTNEKTHQVGLVREIYSSASSVIAYLGSASSDSDLAPDYVRAAIPGSTTPVDQRSSVALRHLFQRPYFSRLWTSPEALFAQELQLACGRDIVPLPQRLSLFDSLPELPWLHDPGLGSTFIGQSFLYLLHQTMTFKCSGPRDRVFALLSLAREKVQPDYSLPVEDVFIGITAYLIKNRHAFEILTYAGLRSKSFNLPSWVPDFSQLTSPSLDALSTPLRIPGDIENDPIGHVAPLTFNKMVTSSSEIRVNPGMDRYKSAQ